jgi:hypothetical protein
MILGGSLKENSIFKKILSIGFELETSELMKFSLHPTKNILINTDTSIKILNEKINEGDAKIIDDNYISHVLDKLSKEELDQMEEDELEYYKNFHYEESEKFNEYFFENQKINDKNNVQFQITNDYSQNKFVNNIFEECKNLSIEKNNMYYLKITKQNKTNSDVTTKSYDLNFLSDDTQCNNFSCVEYVITYYNPEISNNIIINSFIDACKRIIYHLDNLHEYSDTKLYIAENDDAENYINIKDQLSLFNKLNTNLYYLTTEPIRLNDITFTPQMTFRSSAINTVDILKEIIRNEDSYKGHPKIYDNFNMSYKYFESLTDIANDMLSGVSININNEVGRILHCYVFLILYKINTFITNLDYIIRGEDYLKDYLIFLSRHSNKTLHTRIKELIIEKYNIEIFNKLFYQTKILKRLYVLDNEGKIDKSVYEKNINDKHHPNYGNPAYSLISYFEHIENNEKDWLSMSGYDSFSNLFNLINDEVLLENRRFHRELALYLKYNVDSRFNVYNGSNDISIFEMKELIYINDKNKFINGELDDTKLLCNDANKEFICVDKCNNGYIRNAKQKCVKIPKRMLKNTKNRVIQTFTDVERTAEDGIYSEVKRRSIKKIRNKFIRKTKKNKTCKDTEELVNSRCLKKCVKGKIRNSKTNRCIKFTAKV